MPKIRRIWRVRLRRIPFSASARSREKVEVRTWRKQDTTSRRCRSPLTLTQISVSLSDLSHDDARQSVADHRCGRGLLHARQGALGGDRQASAGVDTRSGDARRLAALKGEHRLAGSGALCEQDCEQRSANLQVYYDLDWACLENVLFESHIAMLLSSRLCMPVG